MARGRLTRAQLMAIFAKRSAETESRPRRLPDRELDRLRQSRPGVTRLGPSEQAEEKSIAQFKPKDVRDIKGEWSLYSKKKVTDRDVVAIAERLDARRRVKGRSMGWRDVRAVVREYLNSTTDIRGKRNRSRVF